MPDSRRKRSVASGPWASPHAACSITKPRALPGIAGRAEEIDELRIEGPVGRVVEREVIHVQLERAVLADTDQLPDLVHVARRPEGRHTHDLVLALVDLEAEERGERAVEQAKRM